MTLRAVLETTREVFVNVSVPAATVRLHADTVAPAFDDVHRRLSDDVPDAVSQQA